MKQIFADTGYWIALFYPRDEWYSIAKSLEKYLLSKKTIIVTTDLVLTEFLNFFSGFGGNFRKQIAEAVINLQKHPNINVYYSNAELFNNAVILYKDRLDKKWSLTDCHSFIIMQNLNITSALTNDQHFSQAGFNILLNKNN